MRYLITIILNLVFLAIPIGVSAFTIIIDAGHGGKDGGCHGVNTKEKDINLSVALATGELIKNKYGDKVKVIYTRDKDVYFSLEQRAEIANRHNPDLFLSIHVNSVDYNTKGRQKMQGTSVYIFPADKRDRNLGVLRKQRSINTIDAKGRERPEVYNAKAPESAIAFDLLQYENHKRSAEFGEMILNEMVNRVGRVNQGLRQGPFYVIWAVGAPSVLVELEYMCNPDQEKFIKSQEGIQKFSNALFEAFNNYYKRYNR